MPKHIRKIRSKKFPLMIEANMPLHFTQFKNGNVHVRFCPTEQCTKWEGQLISWVYGYFRCQRQIMGFYQWMWDKHPSELDTFINEYNTEQKEKFKDLMDSIELDIPKCYIDAFKKGEQSQND